MWCIIKTLFRVRAWWHISKLKFILWLIRRLYHVGATNQNILNPTSRDDPGVRLEVVTDRPSREVFPAGYWGAA